MRGTPNPLWNPWENDKNTFELYRRRCRKEEVEMTCAAQAAEIFADLVSPGETLLDAGCGGGYYFWSFHDRKIPIEYYGLDYTPPLIDLARNEMCARSPLRPDRFILGAIEDLDVIYDNILCFNVLTNSPHYAQPLERLLMCARKRILIRESLGEEMIVRYTPDPYLDEGKKHIRVYHNTYLLDEVKKFMEEYGFKTTQIKDRRTDDGTEMVVDIPHEWRILLGERL